MRIPRAMQPERKSRRWGRGRDRMTMAMWMGERRWGAGEVEDESLAEVRGRQAGRQLNKATGR